MKRQGRRIARWPRLAGVSAPMIGYLGIGQRIPTVRTIARLAVALKVSPPGSRMESVSQQQRPAATCEEMGARLQASREEKGLTKAALARLGGLSPSAFAKIENGGQSGIDVIESLAKALAVSAGWLAVWNGTAVVRLHEGDGHRHNQPLRRLPHDPIQLAGTDDTIRTRRIQEQRTSSRRLRTRKFLRRIEW